MLFANSDPPRAVRARIGTALMILPAAVAAFVIAPASPASADSSCGNAQVCVWTGTNYTGTKTTYDLADAVDLSCVNVTFQSLKIGAGALTTTANQYGEENCSAIGNQELTVSALGVPSGNPETNNVLGQFTAHSVSFLQIA
ncbi:peptidase inhibitor family I36 protein [Streptomyces sp. NPDC060031]|uniref:peptidase inhibitor family I36 protein n=1 Tax=Streptomyces sp. NPDC060031 TaxID=3347043 RepID=UPI0036CA9DBE